MALLGLLGSDKFSGTVDATGRSFTNQTDVPVHSSVFVALLLNYSGTAPTFDHFYDDAGNLYNVVKSDIAVNDVVLGFCGDTTAEITLTDHIGFKLASGTAPGTLDILAAIAFDEKLTAQTAQVDGQVSGTNQYGISVLPTEVGSTIVYLAYAFGTVSSAVKSGAGVQDYALIQGTRAMSLGHLTPTTDTTTTLTQTIRWSTTRTSYLYGVELVPTGAAATVPDAPTAVVATPGNAQASVAFTAPASDGGAAITGYTVTASTGQTATGAASPIVVTGLANGTAVTFTVHATNSVGDSAESSASAAVTPATVPGAPTSVVLTAGDQQISVAFTAPGNNGGSAITGYTATATPGGATVSGAGSPLVLTGLANGTDYTVTVHATNAIGDSAESGSANATPATVPATPAAPGGVAGDKQVTLSWSAPDNGGSPITGYTITVTPGGATVAATSTSKTITGLTNGTAYTFTVHATNAVGDSGESPASAAITPAAPVAGGRRHPIRANVDVSDGPSVRML